MDELFYQLLSYARATWRYRWIAVVVAWIIAVGGWLSVYRMPDRFEASARVWLDTQSVIKHFMYGITAQPNVSQMVGSISRTMTGRPNLEKLIRVADMDIWLKTPDQREQMITYMSKSLRIRSPDGELYTISYIDTNAERAKRVVESLLMIFVEESLSDKKKDTEAARRFIDDELKVSKERMDATENAVIQFKRQQMLMTGGRDYTRVVEAEARLRDATVELKIAETNRDMIKMNRVDATEIPSLLGDESSSLGTHSQNDARIDALVQKLDGLRMNFTEQHPDVIAIERTIAQLKEQKAAEAKLKRASPSAARTSDPVPQQSSLTLAAAEANVIAAKAQVDDYRKRYEELRSAAFAAPEMDARYAQLARDYEMAKNTYGALLSRRETARISNEMDSKTSATSFRVVDPPRVPSSPEGPNRRMLNMIVLLLALGGGGGFAFVVAQVRPAFNDERTLKDVSGCHVLGTVVMAWTEAQKARRARALVAFLISFASLLSAYAAITLGLLLTVSRA